MSILSDRLEYTTRCLSEASVLDTLTGLSNARSFLDTLEKEVSRAQRHGLDLSVLLIDVDHFKEVNHHYGLEAGDSILSEMGRILAGDVRKCDLACRWTGQRFAVLLTNTPIREALRSAERFRRLLSGHCFRVDGHPLYLTVSIGVTGEGGRPGGTAGSLMERAQQALVDAKSAGRNCVRG